MASKTAPSPDPISRRPLVPTQRQTTHGESPSDYEFVRRADSEVRSLKRKVSGFLDRFDLRMISGPKLPIAVFLMLAFFGPLDDLVFTVIGPELRVDFASGPAAIGIVGGVITFVTFLTQPFYGWVVDRVKRVYLMRIAHIGGNIVSTASAFSGNLLGFVGVRGGAGLLGVGAQTPGATLLADYYDQESFGRVMTLIPAVQNLALIVGPLLAGLLVSATNWRITVFTMGCIATAVGAATFLLREPERGGSERRELDAAEDLEYSEAPSFTASWRIAKSIHTLRRIWYATPFQVATGNTLYLVVALYFSEAYALTAAQRGYLATVMGLGAVFGLVWLSPLAGRLLSSNPGRLMSLIGGLMVLQAISSVVLSISRFLPISVIATIPLALGIIVVPPLLQMITLKIVPPRMRGLGFSTTAPWTLLGLGLFYLVLIAGGGPGGIRAMWVALIPIQLIGAFLFATGSGSVERDMRAAGASVMAERAGREAKESGRAKLLVCRGVEATYGGTQVLFGIDLDVEEGEILALLGTNGAGKSTLLRCIAGVHHASNGAIMLDGRGTTHEPAHVIASHGVAIMPGGEATFPALTVEENLRAAAWLYRGDQRGVQELTEKVLQFFPILRDRWEQAAGNLSGGEQQMVGLGQAFLMRPRLLMIDELSLGLAPRVIEQMLAILKAIREQGTTIILVEQSVNLALTIADRAVFMEKGEVRFDGETEELLLRRDLIRSVFIGGAITASTSRARRLRTRRLREGGEGLWVDKVQLRFGGVEALRGASLRVSPGEIVGVIGPNGAGKTTLFDVISGFIVPDQGRVLFNGDDVTPRPPDARAALGIGRSFQNVRLFPALTVRENIAVALERRTVKSRVMAAFWLPKVRRSEAKVFARADGLVEILGLEAFADKFAGELSTGSRRAVEVACMMAAEPQVLLLDEPSSGLAQAESEELGPVLQRIVRDTGCGLLIIEHDIRLIASIANRLVAMDLGRVIAEGETREVIEDPKVLRSFLASTDRFGAEPDALLSNLVAALTRGVSREGTRRDTK